ncbi:MAG: hypothetical protein NT051_02030 [Candidatus Micrarchaeota archaeon]|nr:hypothetical protein [Candidatus Micrarchaeota archaeon]
MALFRNKIDDVGDTSIVYNADFVKDLKAQTKISDAQLDAIRAGGAIPFEAYKFMIKTGITFGDVKKIGYIANSDMKGGIPMLDFIDKAKILVKKGEKEARDYTRLNSEIPTSNYSNLMHGMVLLTKDKGGKWQRVSPNKTKSHDAVVDTLVDAAKANKLQRTDIAKSLAGVGAGGELDPKQQHVKLMSTHDFTAQYGNKGMGKGRFLDFLRPGARVAGASGFSELVYSAFYDKMDKMYQWSSIQAMARQTLSQYATSADSMMVSGERRFKPGEKMDYGDGTGPKTAFESIHERLMKTSGIGEAKLNNAFKVLDNERESSRFQTTFFKNFKSSIASKTMKEIAQAETLVAGIHTEINMLKRCKPADLNLSSAEYNELVQGMKDLRDDYKLDRKIIRKDYAYLNDVLISWAGTHNDNTDYSSRRNWLTRSWLVQTLVHSKPYDMGKYKDFYYAVESTTMRSSDSVYGQRFGFKAYVGVGLETGQGAYEPAHMWLNAGQWECRILKAVPQAAAAIRRLNLPWHVRPGLSPAEDRIRRL